MAANDDAPRPAPLDPDTAAILADLQAVAFDPTAMPIAQARAAFMRAQRVIAGAAPAPELERIDDLTVAGPDEPLRARQYWPARAAALPAIVYLHGGGWTFGNLDSHDGVMRRLALGSGATVIGIDYRLAPEHPFPQPLDDAVAAVRWVREHAHGLGVDAARMAVAGDSAGANLALAVLLTLRDAGDPPLRGGGLFYGCFWSRLDTGSHARFGGGDYMLTTERMRWFWGNYLRGGAAGDPRAEPMHAGLRGLPPLYLCAGGYDPVLDDTAGLARRLEAAGAPHERRLHPALIHGFMQMAARSDAAARATAEAARALGRMLASP